MLRVENRFDYSPFEPAFDHMPAGNQTVITTDGTQIIWHILGGTTQAALIKKPKRNQNKHVITTSARLAAEVVHEAFVEGWRDVSVFIVLPAVVSPKSVPYVAQCTAIWRGHFREEPSRKCWGWKVGDTVWADPPDLVNLSYIVEEEELWNLKRKE